MDSCRSPERRRLQSYRKQGKAQKGHRAQCFSWKSIRIIRYNNLFKPTPHSGISHVLTLRWHASTARYGAT